MDWIQTSLAVFKKDLRIEFRTRFAINMVLAFVVASLLLILFTLRAQSLDPTPKSGLVWIIILFAALSALGRSFIAETDKGTYDLLRIYAPGTVVYLGKLFFNCAFSLFINTATFIIYMFLMDMTIVSIPAFLVMLILGTLGLSSVSTMTAAIVSQADRKGAVFSVLSIPLFIPLILLLSRVTRAAFIDASLDAFSSDVFALIGFAGVTITAGVLLFDFIWDE
ncbi:MAG: heme exporter protein CcmB [Balneolaceae bacterium]|nr:heme exporter protein CcmB [Balneolaceae bacterium]